MTDYLTIGKVAKQSRVNIQTVRYYERRRMLTVNRRTEAGYRLYAPEAVRVIRFIKNSQELGFTLTEIAKLLRLRVGHTGQCGPVKRQAEVRLKIVSEKIADLRAMEKVLERLIRTCKAWGTTEVCPMLDSLEERGELK